jgi:peptidoglycan-N-acetylglucosamine deacetylase
VRHPHARGGQAVAGGAVGGLSLAAARTAAGRPVGSASTLAAGAVGLGASGLLIHQWLSPRSWLYGRVFWRAETGERVVALTFDDGPCHPYTAELLGVLEREGVRATFFMPGANVRREPQLAAEVAAGHAIGNHTYSHPHLTWRRRSRASDEMRRAQEEIHDATGVSPGIFRVPHGWYGPQVISAAEELGLRCVGWSVMAWDWNRPPTPTIERRIMRGIRPGGISLLHDGQDTSPHPPADRSRTVAAVPRIIRRLKEEGYSFATVPELMALDAASSGRA